jgi:hypothetical protein
MDKILVQYDADIKSLKGQLDRIEASMLGVEKRSKKSTDEVSKGFKNASKEVNQFDRTVERASKALVAMVAVDKLVELASKIIKTTAEFQKFEAVLTNTLGSKSAAQKALRDIQNFAAKTPFSVAELTASFVKLANQGFKPTQNEMRKLGDLAASTGKSFDMLTEAVIDAGTGEFERLKEFGIRASKEGDKVKFTFKGVETQTQFTSAAIRDYVLSLGDAVGVSGAMAAISDTVGGKISNMGDAFDSLFNTIGSANSGVMKETIEAITSLVQGLELALTTEEQLQKKLEGMVMDARVSQYFGFLEDDIKKLEAVTTADEARRLVIAGQIIEQRKELDETIKQLENQKRVFGKDMLSNQQKLILKELEAEVEYYQTTLTKLVESKDVIDKKETERLKAEEDQRKKDEEKAKVDRKKREKEREEALKKEIEDSKHHFAKLTNIEKERFIEGEIQEDEYSDRIRNIRRESKLAEIEILRKFGQTSIEVESFILDEEVKIRQDAEKLKRDAIKETFDFLLDAGKKEAKKQKEDSDKLAEQRKDAQQEAFDAAVEGAGMIQDEIALRNQQKTDEQLEASKEVADNELAELNKRKEAGLISEGLFEQKKQDILKKAKQRESQIKTKDAENDKKLALVRIAIDTAAAIIKAIAMFGPPPSPLGIAGISTASGLGLLQAGIVATRPIPKFAKGTKKAPGGLSLVGEEGPELVMLPKNSSVFTANATNNHDDAIDAMNGGYYDRFIANKYIKPALEKAEHQKSMKADSMAHNMSNMISLMRGKEEFYDGNIIRQLKNNKTVDLGSRTIKDLAKQVSKSSEEGRYF